MPPTQAGKTVAATAVLATLVTESGANRSLPEARPQISATQQTEPMAQTEVSSPTDAKSDAETGPRPRVQRQIEVQAALAPSVGASQPAGMMPSAFVSEETSIAKAMQRSRVRPLSYAAPNIITPPAQVEQTVAATGMMPSASASLERGHSQALQRSRAKPVSYAAPVMAPPTQTGQTLAANAPPATTAAESLRSSGANLAVGSTPLSRAAPIAVLPRADVRQTEGGRPDLTRNDPNWPPAETVALGAERLDKMRGGFDLPSGLQVSFGVSRVAFVNGNMVSTTNFNIPDVSAITVQQAQALAASNVGVLIRNGVAQSGVMPGMTGTIIQNSMNNQQIQALTTINTTVNSLAPFKISNFVSTLNSALLSAVRPR
jgi:hypothetical protein